MPLSNMYHNMTFDELVREAENTDNKLALELLIMFEDQLAQEQIDWHVEIEDEKRQLGDCIEHMNECLQTLVEELVAAKGGKRKSHDALANFQNDCDNIPSDYLETFCKLWDIKL